MLLKKIYRTPLEHICNFCQLTLCCNFNFVDHINQFKQNYLCICEMFDI